jgi:predicted DNA-binding transcriptional regulator AlpA
MEKLLESSDVALWLKVTEGTLAVWRCTNRYPELRYVRVGSRRIRYRESDVEAFLKSRSVPGDGTPGRTLRKRRNQGGRR